jgi:hypothetical protein
MFGAVSFSEVAFSNNASLNAFGSVTGISGNGQVGSVTLTASANVFPVGLVALGQVKPALVWGPVDDSQNANWAPVNDSQSVNWVEVVT